MFPTLVIKPTIKQHLAYEALRDKNIDIVVLGGGAGGGKSWFLCESRLINAIRISGYKSFIGREELKRLMQSTYMTFCKVCMYHGMPKNYWKLNGQYNYIEFKNGSRIDLLDLKYLPSDPLYERFGSLEYTDGAIDEGGECHYLAFDVLKTRIGRHLNEYIHPTMLVTCNPKKNWMYKDIYKPFSDGKLPPNIKFIQSLYNDNPYTKDIYGKQLSQIRDKITKERLMYGNWEYDNDPSILIDYEKIIDLFTNEFVEVGRRYITADIARLGKDKTVIGIWEGCRCIKIITIDKSFVTETAEAINKIRIEYSIGLSNIICDEDGVGGGVVDILRCRGFVNNAKPIGKKNYANLKSQCYYMFADYVNQNKIYIKINDEKIKNIIIEECEQIKSDDVDAEGKLRIIKKDKVKELLGRSPDYTDMLSMRMVFEFVGRLNV